MHPLLRETLAAGYTVVADVRLATLEFARSLGEVFTARPDDEPIVTVKIDGDDAATTSYASSRCAELSLHTDYATFTEPPRFTITRCIEPDPDYPNKGRSIVVKIDRVVEHLRSNEPGLDRILRTSPVPFRRNAEHERFHGEVPRFPVLDEQSRVRFDATLITPVLGGEDRPDRAELLDAVSRFERLCHRHGERVEVALDRCDVLIIDNRRVVHSRSECTYRRDGERLVSREVDLAFLC